MKKKISYSELLTLLFLLLLQISASAQSEWEGKVVKK